MRPRKVLLLVDPSDDRLSVLSFTLETAGLRVLAVTTAAQAQAILESRRHIDVVAASLELPGRGALDLLHAVPALNPDARTLLLSSRQGAMPLNYRGDAWLNRHMMPAELIHKLRQLCARKRGPKAAAPSAAQPIPTEQAA